ncbi:AsmA-like C-terminal region-containing protein, partial [Candidatus Pelagibacter sp.]|nr:AsmA-like C-terminal region-containing protein [Candidatus Pelagibacter sp.]
KNLLSIIGEGEIKLEENFNKIDYIFKNNNQNFNIQSNLTLDAISLKKQDFIGAFFPSANENINFKNQKLKIKYNNKKLSLSGDGKIKVDDEFESIKYLISTKDKKINFDLDLNLDKTNFEVNFLNYKKKDKIDTQLKIDGYYEQNKNLSLNNLTISEDKHKIEVSNLILNKYNSIINVDQIEFDYLDTENKLNKYSIKKIKKNVYDLAGLSLNANNLITNLLKGNDKKRKKFFQNNIALNINLDEVALDENNYISDLKGNLFIKDNSVIDANLSAAFDDKKNISFSINSDAENNKITTLYSSKAKPLVERYKFIKGFDEGYLDFYSSKKDNISKSKLNIYDFKLKELPVLTKILTLASLQGIADILSGEGIRFDEFEMNFKNQEDLMTIEEIYAIGPAISVLMSGYVEDDKLISLRGTLVPATTINKTISSIPVLGKILVGNKTGEGVFGVSFKIKGPPKNLETSVNPIKTLTPRFITRTIEKIKKN